MGRTMAVTWVEDDRRLVFHPPRGPEQRFENIWKVTRVASPLRTPIRPTGPSSISSATFLRHTYLDDAGHLHNGNAVSHFMRTPLRYMNNIAVVLGVLIAVIGGAGLSYFGTLTLGVSFSALMFYGSWVQRRGFDYNRLYGVWHGLCPNCKQPLSVGMKAGRAKTVTCSSCASCVIAKDGMFRIVSWCTQFL
jgi:hypothetical protein